MNFKKYVYLIFLIPLALLFISTDVKADGGVFKYQDNSPWLLFREESQLCFINYKDGIQNMLINVSLNDSFEEEKAVWLFPIPAKPNETKIDVLKSAPKLYGENFEINYDTKVGDYYRYIYASQFYTLPLVLSSKGNQLTGLSNQGPETLQFVQKYGITTELISVKNKQDFIEYLSKHKINFSNHFNTILDEYIGKDYIFVFSWISNSKEYKNNFQMPLEVYVSFKTPKIFFPLKFTSIYKELNISIFIYILDFVNIEFPENFDFKAEVDYFIMKKYKPAQELSNFFFGTQEFKEFKYTKISMKSEAQKFIDDLWIDTETPLKLAIKLKIYNNIEILFILLFAAISSFSSVIAGQITFYGYKPSNKGFALLGLLNFLSIIFLIIGSFIMKIDKTLLKEKINVNERAEKLSHVALTSLFWAMIVSTTLYFLLISPEFNHWGSGKAFNTYAITLTLVYIFFFISRILFLVNYNVASYIRTFSIVFIIMTIFSYFALSILG